MSDSDRWHTMVRDWKRKHYLLRNDAADTWQVQFPGGAPLPLKVIVTDLALHNCWSWDIGHEREVLCHAIMYVESERFKDG